jgi:hypothetical protein
MLETPIAIIGMGKSGESAERLLSLAARPVNRVIHFACGAHNAHPLAVRSTLAHFLQLIFIGMDSPFL